MATSKNTQNQGTAKVFVMEHFLKQIQKHKISIENKFHKSKKQWNDETKSNLIVSILNNYQIPSIIIAEMIEENNAYCYIIDGIQRTKSLLDFRNNDFKINENIERSVVCYQKHVEDENGNVSFSLEEYDLCGKSYNDLPEELQDNFNDYNLHIDLYSPCSEEDIVFHIKRYNSTFK